MALNINGTTGISGVDGSVSAPAVTGSDSNTGITFPSADTIKFATGGVERMSITNSGVTGITAGITMAQIWRISTIFAATAGTLTSNWEAMDQVGKGYIGSSMSESSGVFTFPSTGIYYIQFICGYYDSGTAQRYLGAYIDTTINNSAYTTASINYGSIPSISGATHTTVVTSTIFDVEDTSTHKCRIGIQPVESGGPNIHGNTNENKTYVLFMRLGDT